jgi:hypothetical protein
VERKRLSIGSLLENGSVRVLKSYDCWAVVLVSRPVNSWGGFCGP